LEGQMQGGFFLFQLISCLQHTKENPKSQEKLSPNLLHNSPA